MFETAGALAIVRPVSTLAGLVYCPLLWAVLGALVARWHGRERRGAELVGAENVRALFVAATCSATTLCFAIFAVVQLAMLPSGHRLVQHVSQLARLGQLDLAMALSLDGRSAVFALVIALIAAASAVHTSLSARAEARERLAWTGLLTAGAMLVCVGDGLLPILVGLGILTLGAWGLSRGGAPSPNAVALTGNASIFLGFVFLFWSLGGAFGPEGYDPDDAPRFVLVTTSVPSGKDDQALLSMTTHAGTLVSSDDADLPGEPVRSPFAVLVPPGIYTLRVQGGVATADVVVPRVALVAGRSHVLAPYGPTASLRVLDDQINVPRLTSAGAPATVRAVLSGRSINGLRASAIVLLLVLGGAMAHLHAFASRRGPSALGAVFETIPAAYLALRLSPLADPSHADGILLTVVGALSAIVLSARASCVADGHHALRGVLAATISVAVTAAGLGEPSAALILAAAALVASSAALAAIEIRGDLRWLGVACAAAVGLLPGMGVSPGYILSLTAALGAAVTGGVGGALFAAAVVLALMASIAFVTLAVFRVYHACIYAKAQAPAESPHGEVVVIALAALAMLSGIVLGAGTTMFGGTIVSLARRLVGSMVLAPPRGFAGAAVLLSLAAVASGVYLARRAYEASAPPGWLRALGGPYTILSWTASGVGEGAMFLKRSVRAMDRDVVADVPVAIRDLAVHVAAHVGRAGRAVSEKLDRAMATVFDRVMTLAVVKFDIDHPSKVERLRNLALFVMVAVLGLVVLSSLLLG